MKSFLILLALILPLTVFGRIGETPEQCEARYGKPVQQENGWTTYRKDNVTVEARFDSSNRVEIITYFRVLDFTADEVQVLLKANANDTWEISLPDQPANQTYHAAHKPLLASKRGPFLSIMTEELKRRADAEDRRVA